MKDLETLETAAREGERSEVPKGWGTEKVHEEERRMHGPTRYRHCIRCFHMHALSCERLWARLHSNRTHKKALHGVTYSAFMWIKQTLVKHSKTAHGT